MTFCQNGVFESNYYNKVVPVMLGANSVEELE